MAEGYFATVAAQLGISIWVLILIMLWEAVWKFIALWKSARNNHLIWFIALAIFNTAGILSILYIFVFSKMGKKRRSRTRSKPRAKRKPARRRKRK